MARLAREIPAADEASSAISNVRPLTGTREGRCHGTKPPDDFGAQACPQGPAPQPEGAQGAEGAGVAVEPRVASEHLREDLEVIPEMSTCSCRSGRRCR